MFDLVCQDTYIGETSRNKFELLGVRLSYQSSNIIVRSKEKTLFTVQWTFQSHLLVEMFTENWKRLLDYKSESNVKKKKNSPNRAYCVLLFWEVKLFTLDLWQTTSPFTSKLNAYNTSMGNSKFNVSDATTLFFLDFLSAQNMFGLIGGKIVYWRWSEWKQKLLRDSRRFGLPRVKITVNVWRKSRGNRFWFELAGFDCTVNMTNINFGSFHYFFCRGSWAEKNNEDTTILAFLSLSGIYFY